MSNGTGSTQALLGLHERLEISESQVEEAQRVADSLAGALSLPVLLSQDGDVVALSQIDEVGTAERLARHIGRIWNEGASRNAREVIRFEEEIIGSDDTDRMNILLFSVHIERALTLTIGWETSISLTRIRAEVAAIRNDLARVFQEI